MCFWNQWLLVTYPAEASAIEIWQKLCNIASKYGTLGETLELSGYDPHVDYEFVEFDSEKEELMKNAKRWWLQREWRDNIFSEAEWRNNSLLDAESAVVLTKDTIGFIDELQPISLDDLYIGRIYLKFSYGLTPEEISLLRNLICDIAISSNPTRIRAANEHSNYEVSEFSTWIYYYKNIKIFLRVICDGYDIQIPYFTEKVKDDTLNIIKENSFRMDILENNGLLIQTESNIDQIIEPIIDPLKMIVEYLKTIEIK